MAISPITTLTAYNTPSFKGVGVNVNKALVGTIVKAAEEGVNAGVNGIKPKKGLLNTIKEGYNKAWDSFIENGIVKPVLAPVMNSKMMSKFADWSANIDNMPSHMATAGSIVTTYFYASRTKKTLNKDEEQKKRAKTLMLNQWMVTGVSTALGYGVNGALGKMSKNLGYKFREVNQGNPKLTSRMKGFDIAKQLLIFTVMYRYVAPVLVTPVASKISKVYQNYKANKAGLGVNEKDNKTPIFTGNVQPQPQPVQKPEYKLAKTVDLNAPQKFSKSA